MTEDGVFFAVCFHKFQVKSNTTEPWARRRGRTLYILIQLQLGSAYSSFEVVLVWVSRHLQAIMKRKSLSKRKNVALRWIYGQKRQYPRDFIYEAESCIFLSKLNKILIRQALEVNCYFIKQSGKLESYKMAILF